MRKQKQFKIEIHTKGKKDFSLTEYDFISYINECLFEMHHRPQGAEYYRELKQQLFEAYFTYRYFQREYNWKDSKAIESQRDLIEKHLKEVYSGLPFHNRDLSKAPF